ncbi:beta-lactamase family protein [Grosmannia clavigera kw1407]|uniref:Beta-lactamase family protein n=1 Tax=Grosmannia clavigera (strain kw1407 / UAMH 11150) TaxID=655863 RepID=F0XF62_GROCL|nr:beta-lactamase family protein [Grosmannia clavigera kw1407]EFX04762.1 beta-lactamase family protein [Grosmannia clavigera kw1407]
MEAFEAELSKATKRSNDNLLGAVAMVVDNKGNILYRHAAGRQFLDENSPPLDPDCTMSLTSAGKFVTNIAALQLVERDVLTLDEPISRYLPEIDKCLLAEQSQDVKNGDSDGENKEERKGKRIALRRPTRDVTLRDLLLNTSGMGTCDTYKERFGNDDRVPRLEFPEDAHYLVKNRSTHLFFEPGEGFDYGWSIYYVQLLVERLGGKDRFVEYANENIFGALGMAHSTYLPAQVPEVWERRLQMVERELDIESGKAHLVASDESTQGMTCSMSDVARLFGDILSPECKLLRRQEHRDMLFRPQLSPGSQAHQALLAETTNYGFLLPLEEGVSHKISWSLSPPPAVNWTVAGVLLEEDDTLPDSGIPKGTVSFEGQPNMIWTMNRERGRMMLFGNQLLPGYDVIAHNLATYFMRHAWKTFS